LLLAGRLNHPFSYSLGPWENISASELVRWSTAGEEVMAPAFGRRGSDTRQDLFGFNASVMLLGMASQSEYGGGHSGGYVLRFSLHLPQK